MENVETNAETLARIQKDTKAEPAADIAHYYTLLDMDFWFLIQQAELVPTLREQESILNYEGKQLFDENKRLSEAMNGFTQAIEIYSGKSCKDAMKELIEMASDSP